MRFVRRHLPQPPCRILDIGCGDGAFVYWLAERVYDSYGVDVKTVETDRVYQRECRAFLRTSPSAFHGIVMWDVLEHIPVADLNWTLMRVRQILASNGKLIIRTPNAEGLWGARLFFSDVEHQWAFTRQSLTKLFTDAGFTSFTFHADPVFVHGPVSLCRWIIWKAAESVARLVFAAETGDPHGVFTQNVICVAE